jgi:biotin carboxyl carrier protein
MAEITSPLTGKILEINANPGDVISQNDEIFIIEAMKMENPINGIPGTVKEIKVNVGDTVQKGDILAIIE